MCVLESVLVSEWMSASLCVLGSVLMSEWMSASLCVYECVLCCASIYIWVFVRCMWVIGNVYMTEYQCVCMYLSKREHEWVDLCERQHVSVCMYVSEWERELMTRFVWERALMTRSLCERACVCEGLSVHEQVGVRLYINVCTHYLLTLSSPGFSLFLLLHEFNMHNK